MPRKRPTVADVRASRGKQQFTMMRTESWEELAAAEAAGIDMVSVPPDTDMLGTNAGYVPRHAKQYADLKQELARIQQMRVEAFRTFVQEVRDGSYPAPQRTMTGRGGQQ